MVNRLMITVGTTLALFCSHCPAAVGPLFNVTVINGKTLCINTTPPAQFYQFVGIKVVTPGYSIEPTHPGGISPHEGQCTASDNGYCLFSTSDKQLTPITVTGPDNSSGMANFIFCLNGVGDTYSCEKHPRTITIQSMGIKSFLNPCNALLPNPN